MHESFAAFRSLGAAVFILEDAEQVTPTGKEVKMKKRLATILMGCMLSAASVLCAEGAETEADITTDRSGNSITLPEQVESIISMAPSTTRILIDLGLADKIVACDTYPYASYGTGRRSSPV